MGEGEPGRGSGFLGFGPHFRFPRASPSLLWVFTLHQRPLLRLRQGPRLLCFSGDPPLCRHHSPFLRSLAHLRPTAATSAADCAWSFSLFLPASSSSSCICFGTPKQQIQHKTRKIFLNPAGVNLPSKGQSFPHPYLHVASRRRIERSLRYHVCIK